MEAFKIRRIAIGLRTKLLAIVLAASLCVDGALAQNRAGEDAAALNSETVRLFSAGEYDRALPYAERAARLAELTFGRDHADTLTAQGNLAAVYEALNQRAEAAAIMADILAAQDRTLGRDALNTIETAARLGKLYQDLQRLDDAAPLLVRAAETRERTLGPDDPRTLLSLNNLGALYLQNERFNEAELPLRRAMAGRERTLGPADPATLSSAGNLGALYYRTGRYEEAYVFFRRVLEGEERTENDERLSSALINYAHAAEALGRMDDAENSFTRAAAILARTRGSNHPKTLEVSSMLGSLYHNMGRYGDAETQLTRAAAGLERTEGPDHPATLRALNNLGVLYLTLERYGDAETLLRRALQGRERMLGAGHSDTIESLHNLAVLYSQTDRYGDAEPLLTRALTSARPLFGEDHPNTLNLEGALASVYAGSGRDADAEALMVRVLHARERSGEAGDPSTLVALNNLAEFYRRKGRHAEAQPYYIRAIEAANSALGPTHPEALALRQNLVVHYQSIGRIADAESANRPGVMGWRARYRSGELNARNEYAQNARFTGDFELSLVARMERPSREALSAALVGGQFGRADAAASAIQAAAARLSARDDVITRLVRDRDAAVQRLTALEAQQRSAIVEERTEADAMLLPEIETARAAVDAATAAIAARVPDYADLIASDFIDLDGLQALLTPGEALIAFVEASQFGIMSVAMPPAWHAMVVTRDGATVVVLPGAPENVAEAVAALRLQATPSQSRPAMDFDLARAHQLYRDIFQPLEPALRDATLLLVVPDGPLQSLPLELLVTAPPPSGTDADDAYRQAQWLGDRFDIAVLPSVSSLRALRRHAGAARGGTRLISFSDPAFGDARTDAMLASLSNSGAEIANVCDLPRVPSTERIGEQLHRALGEAPNTRFSGSDANEARLQQLNTSGALREARVIAFNTHGLTAQEVSVAHEPALALTPAAGCTGAHPSPPPSDQDGFLTASEIVGLELDAEWVLLTACNTAGSNGAPGAEPLSGLARAFFYAGARRVLVSHWPALVSADPTSDGPTELLLAELFSPARAQLPKAAALRQARQMVRQQFAHPAYWATFSLVGDGR